MQQDGAPDERVVISRRARFARAFEQPRGRRVSQNARQHGGQPQPAAAEAGAAAEGIGHCRQSSDSARRAVARRDRKSVRFRAFPGKTAF